MNTAYKLQNGYDYTANDELFPTEVEFYNGCKVTLACSEDGQFYLRVEGE